MNTGQTKMLWTSKWGHKHIYERFVRKTKMLKAYSSDEICFKNMCPLQIYQNNDLSENVLRGPQL